jgi:hypothetical protein
MKKAFLNNDDIYGEVLMLQTSLGIFFLLITINIIYFKLIIKLFLTLLRLKNLSNFTKKNHYYKLLCNKIYKTIYRSYYWNIVNFIDFIII